MTYLEKYFRPFRKNIIGIGQKFQSPYGEKEIIYTDWTASGRLYKKIEEQLYKELGPYVANTHTETSFTGGVMTIAYHKAKKIIKNHVNAQESDVIIMDGSGMTGVINKFQRILGLRIPEIMNPYTDFPKELKPVVFITHMEHHSNQTSWLETIADTVVIPHDDKGLIDYVAFKQLCESYKDRSLKIASVIATSNVTGIHNDVHKIARIIHQFNGLCFVDYACSAPYVTINMHPNKEEKLDAIFFSPHKFLGGPGSQGVLIFDKKLYKNLVPDNPGGGTVTFTNPWGKHNYIENIEDREDGGTPGFLQTIKVALAIKLKEKMTVKAMLDREHEMNAYIFKALESIPNLHLLAAQHKDRLGIFSFYIDGLHFNLAVKLLNDRFGLQTRGGCSCAGTYGHFLLHIDNKTSEEIENDILEGNLLKRPGWVRMSIHPTMTNLEVEFACNCIKEVAQNYEEWSKDYEYHPKENEYFHKSNPQIQNKLVEKWFNFMEE